MHNTKLTTKLTKKGGKNQIDPNVINAQLIVDSINQDQDKDYEGGLVNIQTIVFQNLKELSLSFKGIMEIQNLQSLQSLTKLQLDNNQITRIQNIEHLVHLRWLDLSFNNIEVIEGLDTLTELEDLSLYNNSITNLTGLENCKKLNVFSIGNNEIENFDTVYWYFGFNKQYSQNLKFKYLHVLNIAGNPFTKKEDQTYKDIIIARIPGLKYLDYQFIDDHHRSKIREDDKIESETIKQEDYLNLMQIDSRQEQEKQQNVQQKKEAHMDLVDNLDQELSTISEFKEIMPLKRDAIEQEIKKFSEKIVDTVKSMQKLIIDKHEIKKEIVGKFEQAQNERIADSERDTINLIKVFEKTKKHCFRDTEKVIQHLKELDNNYNDRNNDKRNVREDLIKETVEKLDSLLEIATELKDNLLEVEIQLDSQLKGSFKDFLNKFRQFSLNEISPVIQEHHKALEESINEFNGKLTEIQRQESDKYAQNQNQHQEEEPQGAEEEQRQELLEAKETIISHINSIKEALGDRLQDRINSLENSFSTDITKLEEHRKIIMYERNRKNIFQINDRIDQYIKEIEDRQDEIRKDYDNEN